MKTVPVAIFASALAAFGCGEPKWVGKYASSGTWDLGGPLANNRTVGDSVTDLLVEQLIGLSGVPSLLEAKAEEAVDSAIRPHVKAVVDPYAPAELSPGGSIHQVLAMSLAQVKVESAFELKTGTLPKSMKGSETFTAFEFSHQGTAYRLDAAELGKLGTPIAAEWSGKEVEGELLEVEPHGVEVQFAELALRIANLVIDASGQTQLKNRVLAAVACDQIVARVASSGQGLTISVSDWSYTFSNARLRSACDAAVPMIRDRVLGLFKLDSAVEVGGKVSFAGAPNELRAADGFGGLVGVAPRAIAPRLNVQFTAKRR